MDRSNRPVTNRKGADFEVTTRIRLVAAREPALLAALEAYQSYVCSETLCQAIELRDTLDVPVTEVEGAQLRLEVHAV